MNLDFPLGPECTLVTYGDACLLCMTLKVKTLFIAWGVGVKYLLMLTPDCTDAGDIVKEKHGTLVTSKNQVTEC